MSIDMDKLVQRVAALEARLASESKDEDESAEDKKEASERQAIASEIEALESKLAGSDDQPRTAADEEDDEKVDDKTASLVDPNGIEEDITQKSLTEVEDLEHGTELATNDSMLDAAPTEYVARLKNASSRLDAVAEYLEKSGRTAMALRIDKIADAIDARVSKSTKA